MLSAGEFCNRHVVIGREEEKVTEIARRMREHHVGSIVIVREGTHGRIPIGMITDRDIVLGLVAIEPSYLDRAIVKDLMSGKLMTVRDEEPLYDVVTRMRSHGVRRVPVVDASHGLVGMIAFDDLVEHVASELQRLGALLEREASNERVSRPGLGADSPATQRNCT